jgi:hypothetical protein
MVNGRPKGRVLSVSVGRQIGKANRLVRNRLQPTLKKGEKGRLLRTSQAERNLVMRKRLTSLRNNPLRSRQVRRVVR